MIRIYKQGTTPLYELLEEIHPTNTTTYVDTGIFTSSAISFEVLCKCNPNRNIENDRIIAGSTGWSDWETMAVDYEGTPCLNCKFLGDTGWTTFPSITADNDVHKMYLSSTEFKFDDTILHTHPQTQYSSTTSQIRIAHSYIYQASEQGYYYYYYVKIWDGETLVRHYVPVKRLSDDKYGFYDMVNGTFNPSIGSSDFTGTSKSTPEYIYGITGGGLFVNRIMFNGTQTPIYEILDYITTNRQQVLDSDIQAKSSIKVEMITTLTSRYGNVRLFSTHDPRDYSSQNWAFASGTWGLQFEGSQMCIKPLGTSADNISSFEMLNYYFSNVQNKKYKYLLNCSGLLEIYDVNDVIQFTADCSAKTDLNKVSQTTIRFFGREMQERSEWMNGNTYDIKIYDGNDLVRHYVPVKRLSDNAIGFYETETETFLTSASGTSFTGTSKSTPEYIYGTTGGELFINRIMCNDQSYWGNGGVVPTPPPVDRNYICGYATQANTTYSNILYINNTSHTITTDANKYWELDLADTPISSLSEDIIKTNAITSIDFRHAKFANNCDFTNMLVRNNISYLQNIYFDFTNLTDTSLIRCQGAWFRMCAGTRIHGLGTFKWTGPIDVTSDTKNFFLREFCNSSGIAGTLDLRGYDTSAITDQNPNSSKVKYASYPPSSEWGIWYNCFFGQYDTFIIGNLEMHYINNPNVTTCTTLYCTTQTPPSLGRTGTYGMQCLNYLQMYPNLQHIYVPTGCLSVYQNAPIWSNYASLMSEQDAPDPLTI